MAMAQVDRPFFSPWIRGPRWGSWPSSLGVLSPEAGCPRRRAQGQRGRSPGPPPLWQQPVVRQVAEAEGGRQAGPLSTYCVPGIVPNPGANTTVKSHLLVFLPIIHLSLALLPCTPRGPFPGAKSPLLCVRAPWVGARQLGGTEGPLPSTRLACKLLWAQRSCLLTAFLSRSPSLSGLDLK